MPSLRNALPRSRQEKAPGVSLGAAPSTAHPALCSKPVLPRGAEENPTLLQNEHHCLQHAYSSLGSSLPSTTSPKMSLRASPQPCNALRPVNKLRVLPSQQISERCNLFSVPHRCTSGSDFTVCTPKRSLGVSSTRQRQFAHTSQQNYRKLPKNSMPSLNISKILPSFPILFHALLNICHTP